MTSDADPAPSARPERRQRRAIRALVEDRDLVASHRRHLVKTTTALLRKKGYHNTSTRDIAAAAGMSVGAVYQYIQHKEDLMLLILQSLVDIYEQRVYPLAEKGERARERLWAAVDHYYRTLDEHHDKADVLYHQFSVLGGETKRRFSAIEEKVHAIMKAILDQGVAEGEFAEVNTFVVAHNIVSLGHMWALKRRRFRNIMSIDQYIAEQQRCLASILSAA